MLCFSVLVIGLRVANVRNAPSCKCKTFLGVRVFKMTDISLLMQEMTDLDVGLETLQRVSASMADDLTDNEIVVILKEIEATKQRRQLLCQRVTTILTAHKPPTLKQQSGIRSTRQKQHDVTIITNRFPKLRLVFENRDLAT